jgi:4-hydroxy-3-methylbut-2-enyl diphosphate reductase
VELALQKWGAPVYVRHEIVHNKHVVDQLKAKGAIFVEELHEIPDDGQPVVFSAHGVPKSIPENAAARQMFYIDATCPLVSKVHREAERHYKAGKQIILIGHAGHPEVIGTMGQLPPGAVLLVETTQDVDSLNVSDAGNLAYCTQTTLSVDDTAELVEKLKQKFPSIIGPSREDICYATTNRQSAVKNIAARCDLMLVIGAPNSSNSNRLVEVAKVYGSKDAVLIQSAEDIDINLIAAYKMIGLTAGASAPEELVESVINKLKSHFNVSVEEIVMTEENVVFNIPRILRESERMVGT